MFCDEIKKLIIKSFDEGLSEDEKLIINRHIEICNDCKTYFNEIEKVFYSLDSERKVFLESREAYFRNLDALEVIQKKSVKSWVSFILNPAFNLAAVIIVGIGVMLLLLNQPDVSPDQPHANTKTENTYQNLSIYDDYLNFYLNQDYLIENVDVNFISKGSFFDDALNLLEEFQNQIISNFLEEQSYISNFDEMHPKEIDEIIAQLEEKKF